MGVHPWPTDQPADGTARPIRDATAHELREEPTIVLQSMVDGSMRTTPASKVLAQQELDYRRLRDPTR